MDLGHWINQDKELPDQPFGFVYLIENTVNNKKYIGKKQTLKKIVRKPLKGNKNKRHGLKESDWKTYTSSSNELNEDIKKYGKDNFNFNILKWCKNKWELAYWEAKFQFDNNVLLDESYYNGIINLRIGKAPK